MLNVVASILVLFCESFVKFRKMESLSSNGACTLAGSIDRFRSTPEFFGMRSRGWGRSDGDVGGGNASGCVC